MILLDTEHIQRIDAVVLPHQDTPVLCHRSILFEAVGQGEIRATSAFKESSGVDDYTLRPSQIASHGPTSAFFDDHGERDFGTYDISATTMDENDLRDRATANCAEERHMEILNLASGRLECECFSCCPAEMS